MSKITRRKLITTGLAGVAGISGLAVADKIAARYGLIPPDSGGIYGPGETLTYAAQRLLTRHSMAREFSRDQISAKPFNDPIAPLGDEFARLAGISARSLYALMRRTPPGSGFCRLAPDRGRIGVAAQVVFNR